MEAWVIVALAVVAVAVLALVLFPKVRMRLKAPGTRLDVEGDRRRGPPAPGGVDAWRLRTDGDIDARGHSVELRRGRAGGDITLRAGGSQRADAEPDGGAQSPLAGGVRGGGLWAEVTGVRAGGDVNVTLHHHGHPVAEPSFPLAVGVPNRDPSFKGRDGELDRLWAAWTAGTGTPTVLAQATVGLASMFRASG